MDDLPLSNFDIIKSISTDLRQRANILDTRKMDDVNDVEADLFKGSGHCILFEPNEEEPEGTGHWTVLIRQKKSPEDRNGSVIYFDSYGSKLKDKKILKLLKQKYNLVQYNPIRFQEWGSNPCGRYCLTAVTLNKLKSDITAPDIIKFFKETKPKNLTYDEYVQELTQDVQVS